MVIAVPIGPADTIKKLEEKADRVVCLFIPKEFYAIGQINENFEQTLMRKDSLEKSGHFLSENMEVKVQYYKGRPIEVVLPIFIEKKIVETEPGFRGDTTSNVTKLAKVDGGHEINVPLFINKGDIVKIDTRTGEYVERVRTASA